MGVLEQILEKQDLIIKDLQILKGVSDGNKTLLNSNQICERLKIHRQTFDRYIPDLMKAGLKRIGGRWRMVEADLEMYLESKFGDI